MRLALLADEQDAALIDGLKKEDTTLIHVTGIAALCAAEADVYIDLLFEATPERIAALSKLLPATVIVNAVETCLDELHPGFIRYNGWKSFPEKSTAEVACKEATRTAAENAFGALNKKIILCPDVPGMISPRVIGMIINEAFFALGEKVSTPAEIDIAMKLGTNYPFGPFEWGEKIGMARIGSLLKILAADDDRYLPAPALLDHLAQKN